MRRISLITLLWGLWGFSLGTFILLGPVRKTVDFARDHHWSGKQENFVVFAFIALLIVISFFFAVSSSKAILSRRSPVGKRATLIVAPILATLFSIGLFFNPDLINSTDPQETVVSEGFTIGPYPTEEKLKQLKAEGYTTIISLLHPAVVPFEPKLLAEEELNAKNVGIKLVSIPLLPWITDNEASIEKLRKLVHNTKGKFYVHCYLGRDRVNVAKAVILQESNLEVGGLDHSRSLDSIDAFERGNIYKLSTHTFFTPMPTKEEYFGYIIALKNLDDPSTKGSIQEEERWLAPYKIALKVYNINNISEAQMKLIVDSVKTINSPTIIHAFNSDQPEAELFRKLYNGN
jgi:protein tyrosine phosphatase (PTP) superfamily phosphohydrolase (DUF442 family)